jgi:hypothetical protein
MRFHCPALPVRRFTHRLDHLELVELVDNQVRRWKVAGSTLQRTAGKKKIEMSYIGG